MYISDTDTKRSAAKTAFVYLLTALFCALFGAIYERYSHEVYSFYMIYSFMFPLAGGTLPFLAISLLRIKKYPRALSRNLYHSGIATLTVGSIIRGILDIYGTTNRLIRWYWYAGILFIIAAILFFFLQLSAPDDPSCK
ncbi:MAG: hypothetical protein SO016_08415 [Lachnospiraceae bacterium]|nr:hypothetical protein [Lachnospiraceae bacterium]